MKLQSSIQRMLTAEVHGVSCQARCSASKPRNPRHRDIKTLRAGASECSVVKILSRGMHEAALRLVMQTSIINHPESARR